MSKLKEIRLGNKREDGRTAGGPAARGLRPALDSSRVASFPGKHPLRAHSGRERSERRQRARGGPCPNRISGAPLHLGLRADGPAASGSTPESPLSHDGNDFHTVVVLCRQARRRAPREARGRAACRLLRKFQSKFDLPPPTAAPTSNDSNPTREERKPKIRRDFRSSRTWRIDNPGVVVRERRRR
ncbi:hypothetical protein EVAR_8442_1 [Eumeta japonica]|uniref:Uncharacterized protein n=1 Tax=Eumeta variegata TaxID=151549 RepID=A0A4C1WF81_EUMVA|nr:hypothetical protein EVAR_8442_1 [Eumeta japonica]